MALDFDLLRTLVETPGAPGHEDRIRSAILTALAGHYDDHYIDNIGNLVVVKKATSSGAKTFALAAHMDEISLMVSHIHEDGFASFVPMGGFDAKVLIGTRVLAHGAEGDLLGVIAGKPVHLMKDEERKKPLNLEQLVIDFGLPGDALRQQLRVGDPITRQMDTREMGACITGKSLDNRISVYVLVEALRNLPATGYEIHAGFTVQEEVGLRGAGVFANTLNPDVALNIDTTIAFDMPGGSAATRVTKLGDGVGIKYYDASTIVDKRMTRVLERLADAQSIAWQPEVMTRGGTDTAMLQRAGRSGAGDPGRDHAGRAGDRERAPAGADGDRGDAGGPTG